MLSSPQHGYLRVQAQKRRPPPPPPRSSSRFSIILHALLCNMPCAKSLLEAAAGLFLMLLIASASKITFCRAQDELAMDPVEKEAFYQVMESLNYEWDWRTLLPDPCGINTLQGMACDVDIEDASGSSFIHLTSLSIGQVQVNTPSCSDNATIHPSIAKLTQLRSLSFHGCFMGSPVSIPRSLKALGNALKSLTFQNNPALVGDIPPELGQLGKLERLVLTGNGLHGRIPAEFGGLISLEQLVISRNGMQGEIPSSLGGLKSLVILDLSENRLDSVLPEQLGGLVNLKKLDLSSNRIKGGIPNSLVAGLVSLELLDLGKNELNGSFPDALLGLKKLKELYLNGNPLRGSLPSVGWENLKSLISLDLSNSTYEGGIPEGLGDVGALRFLGLNRNRLAGRIPSKLAALPEVNEINLSDNLLSGRLPFSVELVKRLGRNLKLNNNMALCFSDGLSRNATLPPSALSGLNACENSSLPVAFQVMKSSEQRRRVYKSGIEMVLLGALVVLELFI